MPSHPTSSDAPSWRRPSQPNPATHPVAPALNHRDNHVQRKDNKEKPHDNWRAHANPVAGPSRQYHHSSLQSQPVFISQPDSKAARNPTTSEHPSEPTTSLLSSSFKREKASMLDADWVPGHHPHPDPAAPHSIKPSGMGNGIIGRAPEFGTSPTKAKVSAIPAARHQWPLSSSLEKTHKILPATKLHPLKIASSERSRFFPSASTPLKPNPNGQAALQQQPNQHGKDRDRDDNWMLTPTSSLPSIPSTPNHVREFSHDRLAAPSHKSEAQSAAQGRPTPSIRGPVEYLQTSLQSAPRTPSPGHALARPEGVHPGQSLFNRGPSVNVHASPKRSPLVTSSYTQRQQAANGTNNTALLSPTSSPKLSHRALSPMNRLPSVIPESAVHTSGDRVVNSIASMLHGASPLPRPGSASRRDSFNSITSAGAGHTMSHSRRSSAVFSPNSPTVASRIGVYRPPHLRNRDSVSGLKPSVAHYDRVRTPSLRGLSRSRESSVSLSRPTSRPPSTVPFYHTESIPEDGKVDDVARIPLRGRQSNLSIHLPDLIAEEQQRNAAAAAATSASVSEDDAVASFAPNTTHLLEQPLDSASLLAKLRAQLVRREAAVSDIAVSESDHNSVIADDNEQDFFDVSEMMEYGASEGHPLSRFGSTYALEGRPLGDVFEIGDLLGPGLEHDGYTIKIAETTPGFVDQNEDLTGSKLEVVRKLGEGSYAVVYLVKEVSAEEAAVHASQKSVAIPASASRNGISEAAGRNVADDADLTMVASSSSEDLLSSTLKANGKGKDEGFHNSPALEERRRKDLKVNTQLRPGKEFALKCLCKRDLPEDMLEVQRLEATIHQSIPAHPNIVTLYRTYETPDWLFLVLEYCPGQDLYYWLEQAQDAGRPSGADDEPFAKTFVEGDETDVTANDTKAASGDDNYAILGTSLDATPPSPSLLASTSGHNLLSKRRIRLIAKMFRQICDAVQFCHDRGVSHRDIKPENFIVEDRRTVEEMQSACPDTSVSTLVDSTRDWDESEVIVKMTDFGLATAEARCDDFDCGSKPYMAFECHNNVSSSYDPKQADIWSLGVVLLNLLFHRSPFTEPSMSCPSFSAYCQDPIRFLMESFDGLTETVARFLSENVFCSISDDDDASQKRISAGEFSRWACGLVDHMGLSGPGRGRISRGASVYATIPLIHSRTGSMSTLPSLMSSPRPRARSIARDTDHIPDFDVTADATFRAAFAAAVARQGSLSPHPALFTPDVLPSPTFTPSPQPPERNPFDSQYGSAGDVVRSPETVLEHQEQSHADAVKTNGLSGAAAQNAVEHATSESSHAERSNKGLKEEFGNLQQRTDVPTGAVLAADVDIQAEQANPNGNEAVDPDDNAQDEAEHDDSVEGGAADALGDAEEGDKAESVTTSNHSKRRKRGARKGRTLAKQLKRSQSVEGMADGDANDPAAKARERERTIRELALASENLARQMSKMAKPSDAFDGLTSPQITLSKPTAEAAARYNLQGLAQSDAQAAPAAPSTGPPTSEAASTAAVANWSSAAMRRERMSEQRKTGVSALQDSGRSKVMSWRDRNQSAATLSSVASSASSVSSHSSLTSATSSIYSTASAPAALTRKDFSARNRTRGSGFGLDTISERERAAPAKKEVDAKYLAGIFGGGEGSSSQDKKRREVASTRSAEVQRAASSNGSAHTVDAHAAAAADKADKGNKLFGLLSEGGANGSKANGPVSPVDAAATKAEPSARLTAETAASNGPGQRSVSVGSTTSNSSSSGVAASFVSRFRRPTSSSSTPTAATNKVSPNAEAELGSAIGRARTVDTSSHTPASLGMRRDASTSTSSLHGNRQDGVEVAGAKSNGSEEASIDANGSAAPAAAPKKRGMGKFLLGVRDSIKNF